MKKSILFALMVVGLTVSLWVGISVSQENRVRDIAVAQEQGVKALQQRSEIPDRDTEIEQFEVKISKSQRLRSELQQLFQQRLKTMNDEELKRELARLQKELSEHEANSKLQKAVKLLNEILKTYPKSRAAEQARRMLPAHLQIEELEDAGDESAETAIEAAISRQIEEGN
ncbi:MAG: hypothetical protein IH899_03460 [Planctomycetes bacterium]|nr:hypothetical protein [Planctomycetota bacterium]